MIRREDLIDAIEDTEKKANDYHQCEKLATYYTLLSHLYPETKQEPQPPAPIGYSFDAEPSVVGNLGESDFLTAIARMDQKQAWWLMDELMQALSIINPRLHDSVMRKIQY